MKREGRHSFTGFSLPAAMRNRGQKTCSVGIFEWVPRSGGGLKHSVTKVRVTGPATKATAVYVKAEEIVRQLDAGIYSGPKYVTIGRLRKPIFAATALTEKPDRMKPAEYLVLDGELLLWSGRTEAGLERYLAGCTDAVRPRLRVYLASEIDFRNRKEPSHE